MFLFKVGFYFIELNEPIAHNGNDKFSINTDQSIRWMTITIFDVTTINKIKYK